ncbi:TPA: site-specific DNA-methyltransferase [Serratia liquefaciens]
MEKLKMHSSNLVEQNIEKLAALFPNCITESKGVDGKLQQAIDFDLLKQELSRNIVEGPQERYQLNWPGKREALLTANTPIAKTLRPCREESVNFDTTRNLFIEGDNLDALKLLQETYLGKVKMVYIDPPYNTGNDFIYNDDFSEDYSDFLIRSNQVDKQGYQLVANMESNGRFHSDWLSMLYPRIKLARNLLQDDGAIFISIDDKEVSNLRKICDEIFGAANFVANIVWRSRTSISDDHEISLNHNHTIIYAKSYNALRFYGEKLDESEYQNRDNDPRGPWKLVPLDANKPGGNTMYPINNPKTNEEYWPPEGRSWAINPIEYQKLFDDNRIAFGISGESAPKKKLFLNERLAKGHTRTPSSILLDAGTTKDGSGEIQKLFGKKKVFSYPKPTSFLRRLIQYAIYLEKDQIVLDFFAGSSTTAHAVLQMNAEDGARRRFIMVQLPEPCDPKSEAFKAGFKDIASISKERIKLAAKEVAENMMPKNHECDLGFRVFKTDTSSMVDVYYTPDTVTQDDLFEQVENVKSDRTEEDLLFQVMLDWGIDLALPITREFIDNKTVFFVDAQSDNTQGALVACFDKTGGISEAFIKQLTTFNPLRLVFRDAGFSSDATKINVEQLLKQLSPTTDVKTI